MGPNTVYETGIYTVIFSGPRIIKYVTVYAFTLERRR